MTKGRLEAFSDGVIAIIITVMVLNLKVPKAHDFSALEEVVPRFLGYAMSFLHIAIYWNNHHHMFQAVHKINGLVLWANMNLLFWLSMVPLATEWMGASNFDTTPVVMYGVALLFPAMSYFLLTQALLKCHPKDSHLAKAIGKDTKGIISLMLYVIGIALTYIFPFFGCLMYLLVAIIWLIPDRRIEKVLHTHHHDA